MRSFLIVVATIAGMMLIVPLWVWGATGSWRHALHALKWYGKILAVLLAVGGGFGIIVACSEFMNR